MRYLQATLLLLALYLALTGNVQLNNLLVGLAVAAGIAFLTRAQASRFDVGRLPSAAWAAARYVGIVIADVISGGITVARIVLDPRLPIRPGIVAIPSGCKSDLATALSAHAITLSPGEMVIAISPEGLMYTHCLDASKAAKYAEQAQRLRRDLLSKIIQ